MILITNNPKLLNHLDIQCQTEFIEGSYRDVLVAVRDKIHKGHKLLSHPLSGSVKPNETPYKSVLVSKHKGNMDVDSLKIIEDSIYTCDKFMKVTLKSGYNNQDAILEDFRQVDYELIDAALVSASSR